MLFRLFSYITVGEYMKVEKVGAQQFFIFFNIVYLKNIQLTKENIIQLVKQLLKKLKNKLMLRGFYKVKVYVHPKIGLFLSLLRLEEFEYEDTLDFRVIVFLDEKIYFKTKDYFILPRDVDVYYDKKYFYCDVDSIPNLLSILEFGSFIFVKLLYNSIVSCQKC